MQFGSRRDGTMTKTLLPKSELTDIVRESIRKYDGCDGLDTIVLHEVKRPTPRWEIAVIVAGSSDPDAVKSAAKKVQEQLQALYKIE